MKVVELLELGRCEEEVVFSRNRVMTYIRKKLNSSRNDAVRPSSSFLIPPGSEALEIFIAAKISYNCIYLKSTTGLQLCSCIHPRILNVREIKAVPWA